MGGAHLNFEPGIAGLPPHLASLWGFRSGERGTHTSRTIMLDELSLLLAAVPGAAASRRDYAEAVLDGNCLGKRTAATRKLSLQRLTELYGLDTRLLLFRVLKGLWEPHEAGRLLLALLLALARDPLLRASARPVAATPFGHEFGRLRARKGLFELATTEAGHGWIECDPTGAFAGWMAGTEYRESYFESPEDLGLKLEEDFLEHAADRVRAALAAPEADEGSVVAVFGVASLFGFARVSELMRAVEGDVRGRIVVFFPGEYEDGNYRLLDARDGWSYLAVPITSREDHGAYEV